MQHLDSLKRKLAGAKASPPPLPWRKGAVLAVGGLRAVGFDRHSDQLLVVSSQGRGVVDCISGQKLARDDEEYFEGEEHLEAKGIGPLTGKLIHMAGLHGGGLPIVTEDRWTLEVLTLDWPTKEVFLFEPGSWLYGSLYSKPDNFAKLASESEVRACGFSHTGRSLVIATSSELTIYNRADG
jgi:hypothetical protein